MSKRRAVTPVIATVILISVAVAIGIAVAFWAGAMTGQFSKYSKLQLSITTHYASGIAGGWNVTVAGRNQGSQDLTINQVDIDGIPYSSFAGAALNSSLPIPVHAGDSFSFILKIPNTAFQSGQDVQITVMTAEGVYYPLTVTLP
ncbi:MAG: archaellin/type IV pilin N-terminal domain-containing protein [Conexivisphaerales archaeon]